MEQAVFVAALYAFGTWRFGPRVAILYAAIFAVIGWFIGIEYVALILIADAIGRAYDDFVQKSDR